KAVSFRAAKTARNPPQVNDNRLVLDNRVCLCIGRRDHRPANHRRSDAGGPSPSSRLRMTLGPYLVAASSSAASLLSTGYLPVKHAVQYSLAGSSLCFT